ncbi:hypothetical protein [Xenorhabdus lircayensis]|uniref:Uncharacterized protein n=1 Tax=Xenorhabdus lircayensis TaxID=2763499 RepID=A0ABS0U8P8_9GAMM|nr:hypothetical protein [Xenorhabdus lircayensis]MBI6550255.1 hypothetical protein [Xenorhabdus lircayensis]
MYLELVDCGEGMEAINTNAPPLPVNIVLTARGLLWDSTILNRLTHKMIHKGRQQLRVVLRSIPARSSNLRLEVNYE